MLRNIKSAFYCVTLSVLCILLTFLCAAMSCHGALLGPFSVWPAGHVTAVRTAGSLACAVLAFVYGTCFLKYGVRRTLIPCAMLCALGCVGIAAAGGLAVYGGAGNLWLFCLSGLVLRCCSLGLLMACFQLIASWFIRCRGRMLGVAAMGVPLFAASAPGIVRLIAGPMDGDYRFLCAGAAVALTVLAAAVRLLVRETPEEAGLYPDGGDRAPLSEAGAPAVPMTAGQVLSQKRAWVLIASYGAFLYAFCGCMGAMGPDAVKWMTAGGLLGVPVSFLFGWLDDRFGAAAASLALGLAEVMAAVALLFMPAGGSGALGAVWCLGAAGMTGGALTLQPAAVAHAYGRRGYPYASPVILAVQLIPAALGAWVTGALADAGRGGLAYGICLAAAVLGLAVSRLLRGVPGADDAGRGRAGT